MMKKLITLPLLMLLIIGSAYSIFNFSQALGWVVSAKQGSWEVKALCAASQGAACEGAQFLVSPEGYVQGKGIGMLGQASPELGKAISAAINPQGFITQEAMTQISKNDPKATGGLGETLKTIEQLKSFGVKDGNLKLDTNGGVKEASFKSEKQEGKIGNVVSKDLKEGEVLISNINFEKKNGISTFTFEENGYVKVKDSLFMNIQKGGKLKVNEKDELIEADFSTNEKGGTYVIGNDKISVPPNSKVIFKNGQITITPPEGSKFEVQPSLLKPGINGNVVRIQGINTELPDGSVIQSGTLSYRNGQAFIAPKEEAVINGVEIKNVFNERSKKAMDKEYNVFFDGQKHEGNSYISFDMEKHSLILASPGDKSGQPVKFHAENPFVTIEKNDNFVIQTLSKSEIEIVNRESSGRIPKMTCKGKFMLDEDDKSIQSTTDGKVNMKLSAGIDPFKIGAKGTSTSPVELYALSPEGSSVLKTPDGTEQKLLVSNFKEGAIVPANIEEMPYEEYEGTTLESKISTKITYNYPTPENFETLTGKTLICIKPEFCTPESIRLLSDTYETLTPEAKNSFKKIIIGDKEYFKSQGKSETVGGFAYLETITLRTTGIDSPTTFMHETWHTLTYTFYPLEITEKLEEYYKLQKEYEETTNEVWNINEFLLSNCPGTTPELMSESSYICPGVNMPEQVKKREALMTKLDSLGLELDQIENEAKHPILEEWKEVHGEEYGERVETGKEGYHVYKDDAKAESKHGCVTPYGCSEIEEDIAEFVGYTKQPPEFWKPLLDPKSESYDPRYMKKLNLLLKYKGISQENYDIILKRAGLK